MAKSWKRSTFVTDLDAERHEALIDENQGYDYVRRSSQNGILNLHGYQYLLGDYKTPLGGHIGKQTVHDDRLQNTVRNDNTPRKDSQDGSSITSSPMTSRRSTESSQSSQRPRTVKQQKNKKLQKQYEQEIIRGGRWRCPSEPPASVTWSDQNNVTVIPLNYDERAVDCDGLDEMQESQRHQSSSSPSHGIATNFDAAIIQHKSRQKRSKFPSITRIFERRRRTKSANYDYSYNDILKLAISETDLRHLNQSNHHSQRSDPIQNYPLHRPKSQYDLPMITSKSVDQVTLLGRANPLFSSPKTQNDEFRKKFVKGLWTKSDHKPIEAIESATKSVDSGYQSPETVPKKTDTMLGKVAVAKKSYEHFDSRKASLFNEYFGKNDHIQTTSESEEQVYSQIDYEHSKTDHLDKASHERKSAEKAEVHDVPSRNDGDNVDKYSTYAKLPMSISHANPDNPDYPIVVAIDFGTAYSGYAYAFREKDDRIYLMRRLNTSDPGASSPKCPTCVLLEPDGKFHSFGWEARDYYHDLEPELARRYMYFENIKLILDNEIELKKQTKIAATNGIFWPVIDVLAHCLRYFKRHAMIELSECTGFMVDPSHVQWVITVPAIWRQSAKQLMRLAAYQAGIANPSKSQQLRLALESESASMYCKRLKENEILPRIIPSKTFFSLPSSLKRSAMNHSRAYKTDFQSVQLEAGNAFMLVDCGGGTVDITVHQLQKNGSMDEVHKASGGPHGSIEIDHAFESLLCDIFSADFMNQFRNRYPAAYIDLMQSFETRKRAAHPYKSHPFNVALPFSFLEFYRKKFGHRVECAVKRNDRKQHVTWNSQGMLRLSAEMMSYLFMPTLVAIIKLIDNILETVQSVKIGHLFLVGGFAESPLLQHEIRNAFENRIKIIIPNHTSTAVLNGAVLFGLNPHEICIRRSRLTYGISVLHPFDPKRHPSDKRLSKNGRDWCKDVFEKFIAINDPVDSDHEIIRHYCPASIDQTQILIQIYCTESTEPQFVTDIGVKRCAVLKIDLPSDVDKGKNQDGIRDKEIKTSMKFGDTELILTAVDVRNGQHVNGYIDFLSL